MRALLLLPIVTSLALAQRPTVTTATYAKAEQRFSKNADAMVLGDRIAPNWIAGSDRFWYRVTTSHGAAFMYVDPARKIRRAAFDHTQLAATLGRAADTTLVADSLPFQTMEWQEEGALTRVQVVVRGKTWRCNISAAYECVAVTPAKIDPSELRSPDGRWALSLKEHNLWLRNTATDESKALTTDGTARYGYARDPEANTTFITMQRAGMPVVPVASWSSDSKRIVAQRIDQRRVPLSYLLQSSPDSGVRAKLWTFAFPFPGDSVAQGTWQLFDAASGQRISTDAHPMPTPYGSSLTFQEAWWSDSAGTQLYYIEHERGGKAWWLKAIDVASGTTRTVAEERGPTLVEATLELGSRPEIHVTHDGREIIWPSERDGWQHLYLLDAATGRVKSQITSGPWVVRRIVRVDDASRRIWFLGTGREAGRDPYLTHVYVVGFDGRGLTLLSPEDAHHEITLGAKGDWVIDRYSRADVAPVTVARSLDGKSVLPLERADVSRLLATGWRWPERFSTKAADGVTDLFGLLYKPADFDSTKRYPVIEEIYPGPQTIEVPKAFVAGGDINALVELGMIGFRVDGRGTPFRSKAFHNYSYGHLENGGGLEDHVAALREIAKSRAYVDLDRVGIYGHSGGGFASARAMFLYPDLYKVAVSSAGNHDQRGYLSLWGETYQGMPQGDNYAAQANPSIAKNLKGKLMLVYGDMDDNVAPALTLQVMNALTKANKSFDMMVVPNGSHGMVYNMYFRRRRWDYFVEHLIGATPPRDYLITTAPELPPAIVGTGTLP